VIRRFLEEPPRPHRITVLVQKEVAERIVAEPGSTSVLSIMAQSQSSPKLVATIPPGDFWPAPQIDSALVAFEDITWKFPGVSQRDFFRIVKVGFSARRKKLVNNLAGGLHLDVQKVRQVMSSVHIGENARAQELTLEQWAEIVGALK
jgi:16S rRNA (adenine1518-N6/adenine1519-N6)-dimethyltransferase